MNKWWWSTIALGLSGVGLITAGSGLVGMLPVDGVVWFMVIGTACGIVGATLGVVLAALTAISRVRGKSKRG